MNTECTQGTLEFHRLGNRQITARFDGGEITSDGGALLLSQTERQTKIICGFASCFTDHRRPDRIEHPVEDLVAQRVFGLALGYEDLVDHDDLRRDKLIAAAIGKRDVEGKRRQKKCDRGIPLAGRNTLNRLELTRSGASVGNRYKKVELDFDAVDRLLIDTFLGSYESPPKDIILDVDSTNDPLHGDQEGKFFHGYYDEYCYLPLYVFCEEHLLGARLGTADIDPATGAHVELAGIIAEIRNAWPEVRILIRGDSGFCRDELMTWCEANGVDFLFGTAKNKRLERELEKQTRKALIEFRRTNESARRFDEFTYRTRSSWSQARRVIGKAEVTDKGTNPRFVVTSLARKDWGARRLYEDLYCARGDMENRIKEQKLFLFADRTSTHTIRANQIRLYFSSVAYLLMSALRRIGLAGTSMAKAQCNTIRSKLLKIGARTQITARRIWVSFASGCPYASLFAIVYANLENAMPT